MKPPPEDVKLSREDGEALIARIQASSLAGDDQRLLVKLIRVYFWLTFALSETRISLTRLKRALFGGGKPPPPPPAGGGASGDGPATPGAGDAAPPAATPPEAALAPARPVRRQGHGRHGADAYPGATPVVC